MYDNWHSADVTENGLQNLTSPTIISYIDMFYHRIQISQGPQYSFIAYICNYMHMDVKSPQKYKLNYKILDI
jgi:hypothetical protein